MCLQELKTKLLTYFSTLECTFSTFITFFQEYLHILKPTKIIFGFSLFIFCKHNETQTIVDESDYTVRCDAVDGGSTSGLFSGSENFTCVENVASKLKRVSEGRKFRKIHNSIVGDAYHTVYDDHHFFSFSKVLRKWFCVIIFYFKKLLNR